MYRIELSPGEETALRTPDELATGIRNGVITSRARIWHNAGRKWLPIEFHPHYQAALRQIEAAAPEATPETAPRPVAHPATSAAPVPVPAPILSPAPAPAVVAERPRSPMRPFGLLAGGIVMIAGAQMAAPATSSAVVTDTAATPTAIAARPPVTTHRSDEGASAADMTTPPSTESAAAPGPAPVPDGGVVRGPVAAAAPQERLPAEQPVGDTLPDIPPAPVLGEMPLPTLPVDNP